MKKSIFMLAFLVAGISSTFAQGIIPTNDVNITFDKDGDPERGYFIIDGKKYVGSYDIASWVGETAVCNAEGGSSFQVLFKSIPSKNGSYKIKANATYSYSGVEGEVGIAMLLNDYNDYYGSVEPNKGKVSVKIKNGKMYISVKNAKICNPDNNVCKDVTGVIVIGLK